MSDKTLNKKYTLRCIAYHGGGKIVGVCLDLDLVAEGSTLEDVKEQIGQQVFSYMSYIIREGVESEMFPRPAPWKFWLLYRLIRAIKIVRDWYFSIDFDPEPYRKAPLFEQVLSA